MPTRSSRRGVERFAREAVAAGLDGVIVSDLPPEERPDVWAALKAAGLDTMPLVAPTTSDARLPGVVARASGFVYCLSRTGVTGDDRAFAGELDGLVARVRALTDLPLGHRVWRVGRGQGALRRRARGARDRGRGHRAADREGAGRRPDAVASAVGAFVRELAAAAAGVTRSAPRAPARPA